MWKRMRKRHEEACVGQLDSLGKVVFGLALFILLVFLAVLMFNFDKYLLAAVCAIFAMICAYFFIDSLASYLEYRSRL